MLETLRAWLNGSREYFTGVKLFAQISDDKLLLDIFNKGKTNFTNTRLQDELLKFCTDLKNTTLTESISAPTLNDTNTDTTPNPELLAICKSEANKAYKEVMNDRAILFSLVPSELYTDPNRPDLVAQRSKLSLDIIRKYNAVSQLYDRVDYVKKTGRLPTNTDTEENTDYTELPDHQVKQKLDNLRKNRNKIKSREATAERVLLLQKHETDIKYLEQRWQLLKQ